MFRKSRRYWGRIPEDQEGLIASCSPVESFVGLIGILSNKEIQRASFEMDPNRTPDQMGCQDYFFEPIGNR